MELLLFALIIGLVGIVTYLLHANQEIKELERRLSVNVKRLNDLESEEHQATLSISNTILAVKNDMKRDLKLVADEVMLLKRQNEVKPNLKKKGKK